MNLQMGIVYRNYVKYALPVLVLILTFLSFRTDPDADNAAKAAGCYDSISYYSDGSPRFISYETDRGLVNIRFYYDGRVAHYSRIDKHGHGSITHYATDGRMIYDSLIYGGSSHVKRFDSSGLCDDYRVYHRIDGMKNFGCYLQHFFIDANGKISRYVRYDSTGNILGDHFYPLEYLDNVKSIRNTYPNNTTQSIGLGVPVPGTDSLRRCGLWQTYHVNGKIQSIGMYFAGIRDGLFCEFDTIGTPVQWAYFSNDVRDVITESHITIDTTQWRDSRGSYVRWDFLFDNNRLREGPYIEVRNDGFSNQFAYFYKGQMIPGAVSQSSGSYLDGLIQYVPVTIGVKDHFGVDFQFIDPERSVYKRTCNPFLYEEYCTGYDRKIISYRRTIRENYGESCGNKSLNYMFALPDTLRRLHAADSAITLNDTTFYYKNGNVVIRKVNGYGYQELYYEFTGADRQWHRISAPKIRQEYILLPNGKWFELKTTSIRPPGLFVIRVNGMKTYEVFFSNNFREGWEYSWYENGTPRSEEYFVYNKRSGRYKSWSEDGKVTDRGHYDKQGERTGIQKRFDSRGHLASRRRTVHGKTYGVEIQAQCRCMNLTRKRHKRCYYFKWHDRYVCRLNIICRKPKYRPWWD